MLRHLTEFLVIIILLLMASSSFAQQGKRHYFEGARDTIDPPLAVGMTREEVRELAGGQEYCADERVRNGFTISLNAKKSAFYIFREWIPREDAVIDFFVTATHILNVRYGSNNRVMAISVNPLMSFPSL